MRKKLILTGAALGLMAATAQAQSADDLKRALAQAQAAAEQAQDAARKAQAALEAAQAAAAQARQSAAVAPAPATGVTAQVKPGAGLTIASGNSFVQLYGLIDLTYFSRNHADSAGHSNFSPDVSWFSGNRWGLTGAHAIAGSDGLKAIFRLESEFESQTGNMDTPGVLFNRDAWLGLESPALGKITLGRQNALGRDPAASATYGDPYGPQKANLEEGGYTNSNDYKQLIFYSGSATGTRYDRGVVWKKDWGNVISGLAYQFGGVPGDFGRNRTMTGSLAYNGPNFTVAGFVTRADVNGYKHTTESVGGNVQVSPLIRVNAGFFHYTAEQAVVGNRRDNAWTVSAKFTPPGKMDYELGYQVMDAQNAGLTGSGFVKNAFADTSGVKVAGSGKRKTAYASTFYHLDSVTEFYLAADHLTTTGTYKAAQANGFMSQTELGLGMRFKF
jgi:predicted porin